MPRTKERPLKGSKTIKMAAARKKTAPQPSAVKVSRAAAAAAMSESDSDSAYSEVEVESESESEEEGDEEPISQLLGTEAPKPGLFRYAPGSVEAKKSARRKRQADQRRKKRVEKARRQADRMVKKLLSDKPPVVVEAPKASAREFVMRVLHDINDNAREPIRIQQAAVDVVMYYVSLVLETAVFPDALKRRLVSIPLKNLEEESLLVVVHDREIEDATKNYFTLTSPDHRGVDSIAVYDRVKGPIATVYDEKTAKAREAAKAHKHFADLAELIEVTKKADNKGDLTEGGRQQLLIMEKELAEHRLEKVTAELARAKAAHTNALGIADVLKGQVPLLKEQMRALETSGGKKATAATDAAQEAYEGLKKKYEEASGRLEGVAEDNENRKTWVKERDAVRREKRAAKAAWELAKRKSDAWETAAKKEGGVHRDVLDLKKRITKKKVAMALALERAVKLESKAVELKKAAKEQRRIVKRVEETLPPSSAPMEE